MEDLHETAIIVGFNRFLRTAFYTFYLNCHQRSKDRIVSQVNEAMDDQYRKKAANIIKIKFNLGELPFEFT
jgi:hypothetical protein